MSIVRKFRALGASSFDTRVLHRTHTNRDGEAARHDTKGREPLSATAVRHRIATLPQLVRSDEGQTMTEYGVLLALIAVGVIAVLIVLGPKIADAFTSVSNALH